ncbi:MAG: hypothetical protein AW07_04717 [Candidatus Accumulibacter sp. SK-11]|nr:MAG: hypothetical protein AW07_04717 [Candidatus Accumulibacter sp. SK-11]
MRAAVARAAIRRGCVWPIRPHVPRPSSRQIFGICVVLPEPVSPQTITTGCFAISAAISSRRVLTGRSSANSGRGRRARRAATAARERSSRRSLSASNASRLLPKTCRRSRASERRRRWSAARQSANWLAGTAGVRAAVGKGFALIVARANEGP